MLLGGSAAGTGTSVWREVPGLQIMSANALGLISPCLLPGWTGSLPSRFIYLGFYVAFNTTGHITTGSWKGRGNQYIQFVRVLYCKLPTNGKQLPAFPLEAVPGIEPRPQRWEARVLPLCHHGSRYQVEGLLEVQL